MTSPLSFGVGVARLATYPLRPSEDGFAGNPLNSRSQEIGYRAMQAQTRAADYLPVSLWILAFILAFVAASARAQPLPQADVSLTITNLFPTPPYATTQQLNSFGTITSSLASASALPGSDPSMSASAASEGLDGSTSRGNVSYEFEILAPGGVALDPAHVTVSSVLQDISPTPVTSLSQSSVAAGFSGLEISNYNSPNTVLGSWETPVNSLGQAITGTTNVSTTLALYTGVVYQVSMGVNTQSNVSGNTASASVDPMIALAASDPNSSQYQLVFSPNVTAVPLPNSVWLMLSGVGGLFAMVCRRRRSA